MIKIKKKKKKKEAVCFIIYHQYNSFSFVWIFLKLVDKVGIDEFLEEFKIH